MLILCRNCIRIFEAAYGLLRIPWPFEQRFLVNSGTSLYGVGEERLRQRGTAAHNTVVVDGQDSTEVWAGFRVARRARPRDLQIVRNGRITVSCSHDGYARLKGKPEHRREWTCGHKSLLVDDRITGRFMTAQARFHLHPSVAIEASDHALDSEAIVVMTLPQGQRIAISIEGGRLRMEPATWHPEFGREEPTICLVVDFEQRRLKTMINWAA